MKRALLFLCPLIVLGLASPALAQKKRAPAKAPSEVTVTNGRTSMLTYFTLTTDAGAAVGAIKAQLAPGKMVSVKLAKGAPCLLVVSAAFEDESENAGGQVDVCKDRKLRFVD